MGDVDQVQDAGSPHSGGYAETEADSSPRRPPQLKPEDSFGSTFYGELNEFSLDSQEQAEIIDLTNAEGATPQDETETKTEEEAEEETEPPVILSFKRKPPPQPVAPDQIPKAIPPSYWSHTLYHGPEGQDVIVDYCRTFEQSEKIAKHFLTEPVLGLDMEWSPYASPYDGIKMNASVLQLASEERIAIFHLALHEGKTAAEIFPPALKQIIESAEILKTGVNINSADGGRLRTYLNLQPKGLFELSHLYNLLSNNRTAGGYIMRKLKSMSDQVEAKLGLPLLKDSVRTSRWDRPLNQSQISYAATDAYAGFMLFHVMNEQRKVMKPAPPRPEFAELGLPIVGIPEEADADDPSEDSKAGSDSKTRKKAVTHPVDELQGPSLVLQVKGVGDQTIRNFGETCLSTIRDAPYSAEASLEGIDDVPDDVIIDEPIISAPKQKKQRNASNVDDSSKPLFNALCAKRREIAAERSIPSWQFYRIANNGVLKDIAEKRPTSLKELREINGVGDYLARQYGETWLSVIRDFDSVESSEKQTSEEEMSDDEALNITPDNLPSGAEGCLAGERIVFTGILDCLGRTAAQELATICGAEVLMGPDSETTLVVTGRNVSESKLQAITDYNLQTISEEKFLGLIRTRSAEALSTGRAADTGSTTQHLTRPPLPSLADLMVEHKPSDADELSPADRPFFNALKALRTQLSSLSKLKAETICSDSTLHAIALAKPRTRANLVLIPGARALDNTAQRHNKNMDNFLEKHNRSFSAPASNRGPSNDSISDGSEQTDKEDAFETTEPATSRVSSKPAQKWVYGEFPTPPPAISKKRKF
ncbi:BRCT domain-containing protein [Neofusicoccum parvum]|uniref:BRCT domain-containing protein n=1 Tax=Neofusicoccum parvum TaxID=310453 RepID=A0ACB5SEC0_9PEZI|nr:BRCT domain-containing protein [Neofusicoccum parvum]